MNGGHFHGRFQRTAFDGEDDLVGLGYVDLENAHVKDIERDGDAWLFWHGIVLRKLHSMERLCCPSLTLTAISRCRVLHGNSWRPA